MFRQARRTPDGATEGDHAASAARQFEKLGGKKPKILTEKAPPFPAPLAYLWGWFLEVLSGVPPGGFAPAVVTWSDLKAWSELSDETPAPWESRTIIRLGVLRANTLAEEKPAHGDHNKNRGDRNVGRRRDPR